MGKKLLSVFFLFSIIFLSSFSGFGQCSASVSIQSSDSDNNICAGESVTFTASPTNGGSNPLYQWRVNGLNVGTKSSANTFTTSTLQSGQVVSVVLTSDITNCGTANPVVSTNSIATTVNSIPSVTTANTATICSGTNTNISLTASTPSSFSWTVGTITSGITGASAGSGAVINQTLTNPSNSTAGTVQYIVTPTSTEGNCAGTPYTITVTVNPRPLVTTANTATICSGAGPNISLTSSTPSSFAWTIGTITEGITGASNGSGATINQTLANPSSSTAGTVQYIVTPIATGGSCEGTPYTITVSVNPRPTVTSAATATICSGTGPDISLTASTPSSFSWTIGTISGGITGASNGSGATINQILTNPSNSTVGTVQYIVTPTATTGGCPGTSQTITVTVNPKPIVTTASTATICSGTGPDISLTASTPSSFAWTIGVITGGITGASAGAGSTINQILTNPGNSAAGTVQYIVTPTATAGSCPGTPYTITVTVNPIPSVTTAATATICSGAGPNISLTASVPSSFAWTIGAITGGITGASAGSGATINQTLTNPTNSTTGTVEYIVTPTATAGSCAGAPYTITVTVNPRPTVTTANTATVCSGFGPNISLAATTPSSFSWTIGTITEGITGASASSGSTINQTLTNPSSSTAGTVQYIVTPTATAGTCAGTPYTITVTVNPTLVPSVSITSTSTAICTTSPSGSMPVTFTATPVSGGASPTYQWKNGGTNVGTNSATYIANSLANNSQISVVMTSNVTCASSLTATSNVITMTGFTPPAAPVFSASSGNVNVSTGVCPPVSGLVYTVNADPNATSYVWTVPSGWNIVGGAGTNSITVNVSGAALSGANFNIIASAKNACGTSSQRAFSVRVNNSASVYAGLDASICKGGSIILSGESNGYAQNYEWTATPAGGNFTNNKSLNPTYTPPPTFTGTISLKFISTKEPGNVNCPVVADEMILTVNAPPAIATQPSTTSQTLCPSAAATPLSVTASGAGLTYQWYSNTTNSNTGGTSINGATSATYTPITTTPGTFYYYVIVSGTCASPVKSNVSGAVNVNAPPAITIQPSTTAQTVCLNATATQLFVTATGAGLTYQWYSNTTNSNTGGTSLGAGATLATYTPLTTTAGTLYYYAVVSGTCTPAVNSSVSGAVTVNSAPAITTQPSTTVQTLCLGAAATQLSVTATGAGLTYQWYSNITNSNTGGTSLGAGATSATYTPLTTAAGTLYYYAVVSGTCTPPVTSSVSGAVNVNSPPEITAQPATAAQTLCLGAAATQLSVTATGAGLNYQWYSNTTNSNSGGTTLGASATSSTYTPQTSTAGTSYYYVVVSGTCASPVISNVSGAVNVNAPPAITTQPSITAQTVCLNAAATQLSVTPTGAGLTYQWYSNTTNSNTGGTSMGAGATSATHTPQTSTAGTSYYYVVVSGTYTPPITSNVSGAITVNTAPEITVQPSTTKQNLCKDAAATEISVTATGEGLTFQWYSNTTNSNSGGTAINGANSSTYTPVTTTAGTLYYYVVVSGTCTPAVSSAVSGAVIVNEPVAITTQPEPSQTVCSGFPVSFSVSATGTGLTYQWQFNGSDIPGATNSTYNISQAGLSNSGNYKVIVKGTAPCSNVTSEGANLVVNESIKISSQPIAAEACEGNSASFTVEATGTGLTYQWRKNNIPISGATDETLTINNLLLADAGNYDVVISGTDDICSQIISNPATLTVTPTVTINPFTAATSIQCQGAGSVTTTTTANNATGITYSLDAASLAGGNTIVAATGAVTYSANWSGTTTITASAAGCNGLATTTHLVTVTPTVTINPFTAATSTRCQGAGSVTTTTTANNATGITYSLDAASLAGGNTIVAATGAVTYSANWSGTTTITASAAGCNGPVNTTHVVTVTPTVTINPFTAATSIRCQGAGSVTTTTTANNATGITYSLDAASLAGGNTIVAATGAVTYSANWSGTTTITASAAGCNGPVNTTHVVTVTPTVTINPFTAATSIRCQGAGSVTTTTTANNATGITYSLDTASLAGGNTIVAATGAVTYSANWSGTTTITASAAGCNGPVNTTHVVTVTPTVTINPFTAATSIQCQGARSVTTTTTANNATGITYSLDAASLAGGNTIVAATGAVTYSANWSGTTTITASAAGCNGLATTTHLVTVTPTVTINPFTAATSTRCQGAGSVTTTTTANNATGITYSLDAASLAGGNTIVAATGAVTYSANWSGTTTITASAAGCNGPATTTHMVTVTSTTVAGTVTGPSSVCISSPVGTLTLAGNNGAVVRWEKSENGGTSWTTIAATTNTYQFPNLTVPTRFRAVVKNGVCAEVPSGGVNVVVDPLPVGGKLTFGTGGRIHLICENPIGTYGSTLNLSGQAGTIVSWQYRYENSSSWSTVSVATGPSLTLNQVEAAAAKKTTVFRAEIRSGACTPNVYSETAILSVVPSNITPTPVNVNPGVVCKGDAVTLSSSTGYGQTFGKFDGGGFDNAAIDQGTNPWRIKHNGAVVNFQSSANNTRPNRWNRTQRKDFITANLNSPYSIYETEWNTTNPGQEHFAIVSGNNSSSIETSVFALAGLDQALLTFDQGYNLTPGATIKVEISTDGGNSYNALLFQVVGASTSGNYDRFGQGTPGINKMVIDLGQYIGRSNLRIRFSFDGARDGDVWALDNIIVPEGPRNISMEWRDYSDPTNPEGVFIGNNSSEQWTPTLIGWNIFEIKTKVILNSSGVGCSSVENVRKIRAFVFDDYTTNVTAAAGTCGNYKATLSAQSSGAFGGVVATYPTKDGYIGEWVITKDGAIANPATYTLSNSDPNSSLIPKNNPNAQFEATIAGEYTFSWKLISSAVYPNDYFDEPKRGQTVQNSGCPPVFTPTPVQLRDCTTLDFDGFNDFADLGEDYTGDYSIEAWIRPFNRTKPDGTNTDASKGTIISTPNLEVNMSDLSGLVTPNGRWYHIAVDSDGKLYIDGIASGTTISKTGTERAFIGARWNAPNTENHFSGWIEEVRIWNGKISEKNIRFTMNQRLKANGNIGVEVDMVHPDAPSFGSLAGYYQLIATNILNGGYTPNLAGTVNGKLRNMETLQENTAPLPYTSKADGNWVTRETWTQPVVWDYPNSTGYGGSPIDWNIVRTSHDINANREVKVLGLISVVNTLEMEGSNPAGWVGGGTGNPLYVTHYLKLDGVIDLQGESQLIQPQGSIVDENSGGSLQRDQQGTANSFNYNYWSSPVSPGTGNIPYTVAGVLKDGTNPDNPVTIDFDTPYWFADAGKTNPIKISDYWISIFNGNADEYGEWAFQYGSAAPINVGEGYTMKGTSGNVDLETSQNYTFEGLPNNGTIELMSGVDKNYLLGNPYPSAIDAHEFINDNLAINRNGNNYFDGALYFWDHFGKEDSHILLEYVGGYAALTKIGSAPAISNDERINANLQENTKRPGRYIPVGQGFFINSTTGDDYTIDPGMIRFENDQRVYITEESINSSQFLKPEVHEKSQDSEKIEKIRISYKSPLGYYRQILVGAHPSATNGFDLGYDAPLFDYNKEDMYWIQDNNWLVIQGVSNFDKDQVLPLGIVLEDEGEFTIKIDTLENMEDNKMVYIRDILNDTIHNLTKEPFVATSKGGYINDRFEIIFYKDEVPIIKPGQPGGPTEPAPGETPPGLELDIRHGHDTKQLQISNPLQVDITNVYVYDLNGKLLQTYYNIANEKVVLLPVRNFSSGVYIVKLNAENQVLSKKIIIND